MILCTKCKKQKPKSAFRTFKKGKNIGKYYPYCNECYKAYTEAAAEKRHIASACRVLANEERFKSQVKQLHAAGKEIPKTKKNPIPESLRLPRRMAKSKGRKK